MPGKVCSTPLLPSHGQTGRRQIPSTLESHHQGTLGSAYQPSHRRMWSKLQSSSKAFYCHNVPSCLEKHRKCPQVSLPTPRTTQAVSRSAVKFPKCPRLGATAMSGCIMAWYSSTLSVAFSDPTATVTTAMLCCVLSSTAALNTEGMMSSTPGSTGPWSLAEGLNPGSVSGEQDWSRSHGTSGLYSSHPVSYTHLRAHETG